MEARLKEGEEESKKAIQFFEKCRDISASRGDASGVRDMGTAIDAAKSNCFFSNEQSLRKGSKCTILKTIPV